MLRKEWSLIANSILIQMAAGLFLFLAVYRQMLSDQAGFGAVRAHIDTGMMLTGPLILAGMILSLFHLGRPARAVRAIAHLRSSWLSREVLLTGVFLIFWLLSTWLYTGDSAKTGLIWLTVSAGLAAVACMSGIYEATGKPGWSGGRTLFNFVGTLLIFGSAGSALILMSGTKGLQTAPVLTPVAAVLALLVLTVRLLDQLKLMTDLITGTGERSLDRLVSAAPLPQPERPARMHRYLTLIGWVASFAGTVALFYLILPGPAFTANALWIAAAVLVAAGELLQRAGFNSLGLSDGPGTQGQP